MNEIVLSRKKLQYYNHVFLVGFLVTLITSTFIPILTHAMLICIVGSLVTNIKLQRMTMSGENEWVVWRSKVRGVNRREWL